MAETIAFLGLGGMGSRMAERLRAAGHPIVVWNRTAAVAAPFAERGVRVAATPREAAEGAAAVIAMLRDDAASDEVWMGPDGALAAMAPGTLAVEMSTLSPPHVARLAAATAERGVRFAEAPVAGSLPQAEAGELIILVSGEEEAAARAATLVAPMGRAVHRLGPTGRATAMKLAINTLLATQVALVGELFAALRNAGFAADDIVAALSAVPATSPAAAGTLKGIAAGDDAMMFPLELMVKDLDYATGASRGVGVEPRVASRVLDVFREAVAAGYGGENFTAVAKLSR